MCDVVSETSPRDVERVILATRPDAVVVELCRSRSAVMAEPITADNTAAVANGDTHTTQGPLVRIVEDTYHPTHKAASTQPVCVWAVSAGVHVCRVMSFCVCVCVRVCACVSVCRCQVVAAERTVTQTAAAKTHTIPNPAHTHTLRPHSLTPVYNPQSRNTAVLASTQQQQRPQC